LYVLAVEPRALVLRSSDTGAIATCSVELQYCDTINYRGVRLEMTAPVLLPSLSLLSSVTIADQEHWSTVFRNMDSKGWSNLITILNNGGDMAVKSKSGAGLCKSLQWSLSQAKDQVATLSSLPSMTKFLSCYLSGCPDHWVSSLTSVLASSLASATPHMVPVWSTLLAPMSSLVTTADTLQAVQIRTLMNLARSGSNFVNTELVLSLSQKTNENLQQMASKSSMTNTLRQSVGLNKNLVLNPYQKQYVASTMLIHSVSCISESTELQQNMHLKQNPLKLLPLLKKSSNPASLYRLL